MGLFMNVEEFAGMRMCKCMVSLIVVSIISLSYFAKTIIYFAKQQSFLKSFRIKIVL